jgi:hypothetical protein
MKKHVWIYRALMFVIAASLAAASLSQLFLGDR